MPGSVEYWLRLDKEKKKIILQDDDKKRIRELMKKEFGTELPETATFAYKDEDELTIKITYSKKTGEKTNEKTYFLKLDTNNKNLIGQIDEKNLVLKVRTGENTIGDTEYYYISREDPLRGPGNEFVGRLGIILTSIYLISLPIIIIYCIMYFWPSHAIAGAPINSSNVDVTFPYPHTTFSVTPEGQLFVIVGLAGALGSIVHALRSFYWFVGHRLLKKSWLTMYVFLPFSGAALGLIFYIAFRGGLFPEATIEQTSPFGFAALSALVGLFSVEATAKLQEIAHIVFKKPEEGHDRIQNPEGGGQELIPERRSSEKEPIPQKTPAEGG